MDRHILKFLYQEKLINKKILHNHRDYRSYNYCIITKEYAKLLNYQKLTLAISTFQNSYQKTTSNEKTAFALLEFYNFLNLKNENIPATVVTPPKNLPSSTENFVKTVLNNL